MRKDASVRYEWSSAGGGVNCDTHGDPVKAPKGFYHGYGEGRNGTARAEKLQAAFDGKHGWFWRNRSGGEVTVTLKTRAAYDQIERVLSDPDSPTAPSGRERHAIFNDRQIALINFANHLNDA